MRTQLSDWYHQMATNSKDTTGRNRFTITNPTSVWLGSNEISWLIDKWSNFSKTPWRSLSETVTCPYQGLFIDFAFPGKVAYDKEGKVIESSRKDIEGLNGESAWVLITDAQTKMIHGDARTSKASPLKYLESFLEEYSPNVNNKFVVLDQGGECYRSPAIDSTLPPGQEQKICYSRWVNILPKTIRDISVVMLC